MLRPNLAPNLGWSEISIGDFTKSRLLFKIRPEIRTPRRQSSDNNAHHFAIGTTLELREVWRALPSPAPGKGMGSAIFSSSVQVDAFIEASSKVVEHHRELPASSNSGFSMV